MTGSTPHHQPSPGALALMRAGRVVEELTAEARGGTLRFTPSPIGPDRAFAIRRVT